MTKLYQIVYNNDDTEQYYHNEERYQQKRSLSKRRQRRKPKSAKIHHLYSKYDTNEIDFEEHVMTLTVENIRAIASLQYNLNISTKDVPIEMLKLLLILYNLIPSLQ